MRSPGTKGLARKRETPWVETVVVVVVVVCWFLVFGWEGNE